MSASWRVLGLLAVVAGISSAEPVVWNHLPIATYREESMSFSVNLPDRWQLAKGSERIAQDANGRAEIDPSVINEVMIRGADGKRVQSIVLVQPGDNLPLTFTEGRLYCDQDLVVLATNRREYDEDRRWKFLRKEETKDTPCQLRLRAPAVAIGESGLLALIAQSRQMSVWKQGVVIEIPASDRLVGWKHREFRQVVAWLVADVRRRGARRVVLVQPPAPRIELAAVDALRNQVRDVAKTYSVEVLEVGGLANHDLWEIAPGLLGDELNPGGQAALDAIVRPVWKP